MESEIKQLILSLGADVCGIADIDGFSTAPAVFSPSDLFKDCKSVIVFGIALPQGITKANTRLVYGYYNSLAFSEIDRISLRGAKALERQWGDKAIPIPCDNPYEYWDSETSTGKGLISMKHAAVIGGLGTLGKNSLLLNPEYGNLLVLGAILFERKLQADKPSEDICIKNCKKCIESCPVQAIHHGKVNQRLCRQNAYGKTSRGFDTVDCNRCRFVCPMKYGKQQ